MTSSNRISATPYARNVHKDKTCHFFHVYHNLLTLQFSYASCAIAIRAITRMVNRIKGMIEITSPRVAAQRGSVRRTCSATPVITPSRLHTPPQLMSDCDAVCETIDGSATGTIMRAIPRPPKTIAEYGTNCLNVLTSHPQCLTSSTRYQRRSEQL